MDPVIGALALFAEDMDLVVVQGAGRQQLLDEVMADHAVADDDQTFFAGHDAVHGGYPPAEANQVDSRQIKRRLKPCGLRRLCLF